MLGPERPALDDHDLGESVLLRENIGICIPAATDCESNILVKLPMHRLPDNKAK